MYITTHILHIKSYRGGSMFLNILQVFYALVGMSRADTASTTEQEQHSVLPSILHWNYFRVEGFIKRGKV
jgi:hypothetical protein